MKSLAAVGIVALIACDCLVLALLLVFHAQHVGQVMVFVIATSVLLWWIVEAGVQAGQDLRRQREQAAEEPATPAEP